jgi:arsenate reductase (glutaredoxin)
MNDTVIYHNPGCGTSRQVLARLRESGIEPVVIEYLKTPLDAPALRALLQVLNVPVRELLRAKEPLCAELGLLEAAVTDAQLIEAMAAHPKLMNRPVVVTPRGARLCRPPERLTEILPQS